MTEQYATPGKPLSPPVTLSEDDRVRMRRLHEEVAGRFREMSLIIARTLKRKMGDVKIQVSSRPEDSIAPADAAASQGYIKICFCEPTGCGCWEDPPGICYTTS